MRTETASAHTLKQLEGLCAKAERAHRRTRLPGDATVTILVNVPVRGHQVEIAPGLVGEIESPGDGLDVPSVVILRCADVRAYLDGAREAA